jgi:spore coat protein A, manganese oxidase
MVLTSRKFKKGRMAGWVFVLLLCGWSLSALADPVPGGSLDPTKIPKFVDPLFVPGAMPKAGLNSQADMMCPTGVDYYEIALRQFGQQVLPTKGFGFGGKSPYPKTTVWGYGATSDPTSFHWPAPTIEAETGSPVRVRWINDLKDASGKYLPPLFAVDQTLHWANPPMECIDGMNMSDCRGQNPMPYTGPVPMVPHLHGAHVQPDSDGYPEAWFLPAASNIPQGYATRGSHFDQYPGTPRRSGEATYQYPNTQRAATLWYHDHVLGITRLSVQAGAAGFYLLRGGSSDLPAGTLPSGPYEIPMLIQDRSFNSDGSIFFPDNRAFFEGLDKSQLNIPFIPGSTDLGPSDVSPIWNPEFFGNTITVNGKTWPYINVEPRRYRFRILNGCNARTLILNFSQALPVWQIGADGGFLKAPAKLSQILIAPAERADVIVDFTGIKSGTTITMQNLGPDSPFGGGSPGVDFPPADPGTTGKVIQFKVGSLTSSDRSVSPAKLQLPGRTPLGSPKRVRQLSTNELSSSTVFVLVDPDTGAWQLENGKVQPCDPSGSSDCQPFGPTEGMLGTLNPDGSGNPKAWMDPITENPALNSTEIWEIHNFTEDAHPIHLHLVQFEVVNRQPFGVGSVARPPEAWETGTKDTLLAYPGEITRIKAKFDMAGLYVWHCHILDHEDNEMMRPYYVGPMPPNP